MKKTETFITLSSLLTRALLTLAGLFLVVSSLLFATFLFWLTPTRFSAQVLVIFWLILIALMLPVVFFTYRFLVHRVVSPVTHLITNIQSGLVQHQAESELISNISEFNILEGSINQLAVKILQRENYFIDSEKRLSLALVGSREGIWDWNIEQNKSYIDDNCCELIGVAPELIKQDNRLWLSYLHPDDKTAAKGYFRRASAGDLETFEQDYRVKKPGDKSWGWIQIRGSVVERDLHGYSLRMAGTISDVTERKTTEQQLKLYSMAFMCTKNAVIMLDKDFIVLTINRAFTEITHWHQPLIIGKPYAFHHPTLSTEKFHQIIKTQVHNRTQWLGEAVGKRADNTEYPQDLAIYGVFDDRATLTHYVAVFSDITERKTTENNLRLLANYDPLTGLANRYMFNATLIRSLQSAKRKDEKLALLFLDLDYFKQVNDFYGHEAGDYVLIDVANRLQNSIRETDTAARLAGDEFVVILENIQTLSDVEQIASKIVKAMGNIGEDVDAASKGINISASVGISLYPEHGIDVETLLRKADQAMYKAKTLGRNQLMFYNPNLVTPV